MPLATISLSSNFLGKALNSTLQITEEIVEVVEETITGGASDVAVPVGVSDTSLIKGMVMLSDQEVTFKVDAEVTVFTLTNMLVFGGAAATIVGATADVLKFSNAGVKDANVQVGIVRSSA